MICDLEAEKALAVALSSHPDAWDYVGGLTSEMFFGDAARDVFQAVKSVVLDARPVTPVAVQAELLKLGRGKSVVPQWLTAPSVRFDEVELLAERVRELWMRRRIAEVAARVAASAESVEAEKSTADLGELLSGLSSGSGRCREMTELLRDYYAEVSATAEGGGKQTQFQTGLKEFDAIYQGITSGELVIIGARPGQGKSSLVMSWATHLARTGVPVGVFWLEDDWRDAVRRFVASQRGAAMSELRGDPKTAEKKLRGFLAADYLGERIFIDDTHGLTTSDIVARMRRMVREHGVRAFFADHVGELQIEREDRWGDRHDLALGRAACLYRDAAKELNAVPVLCSQLNRQIERRTDPTPQLSDLDGSGKLEAAARMVVFTRIERNEQGEVTGRIFLDVQKANSGPAPRLFAYRWNSLHMRLDDER